MLYSLLAILLLLFLADINDDDENVFVLNYKTEILKAVSITLKYLFFQVSYKSNSYPFDY